MNTGRVKGLEKKIDSKNELWLVALKTHVHLTSSNIQTLHGQHPVIVACIIEPVLHYCILGKLLQDFHSLTLKASLVKC